MIQEITAIIPARGGSKRIPRKNIKSFNGRPLIYYTIDVANKSKYIDRVIVSTEDKEIAEVAIRYGAEVIERPVKYAQDDSSVYDAIFHVLNRVGTNLVVLLQPTSPLRTANDIDEAIRLFSKTRCDSLISISEKGPNGAIYIARPQTLRRYKSFYTKKMIGYIMPPERSINIDVPKDWQKANELYSRRGRRKL